MKPATPVLPPDVLLGQADFVRALSRSLLADPSAAEDVAQETLVAGLERPPAASGALRGWLARVVRNLVLQRGRGEARRGAREKAVARAERIPSRRGCSGVLGQIWGTPESAFAVTNSATDGSFAVRSCPDLASLWARATGHAPSLVRNLGETREQPEGTTVSFTLALGGTGASVTGVVRDPEGNPIEGALVLVDGQDMLHAFPQTLPGGQQIYVSRSGPTCVRTDASGNFAVAGVLPGTVPLGVLAPGYAAWRGSVSVAAGETGAKEITLTTGYRLVGTVRDGAGNPVGARVQIWAPRLSALLSPTVMTGPDGGFEIDGISPGEIHVNADCAVGVASTTLTGQAGEELTWDAILEPETGEEEVPIESEPWK